MSAFHPMADIRHRDRDVRFVPRAVLSGLAAQFLSTGITGSISRDDELMMFKQLVPTLA
jgi:hypothetical protein